MSPIAVDIIHPSFRKLKNAGPLLHLVAALLIVANAFAYLKQPEVSRLYFWCQLIVAADIFILVFAGREIMENTPRFGLFFRMAEALIFSTVSILAFLNRDWIAAILQLALAIGYIYLFYCEKKTYYAENITFQHLGVNLPGFPQDRFIYWVDIRQLDAGPRLIRIETRNNKVYQFDLPKTLQIDELAEIHEFCRHYLK